MAEAPIIVWFRQDLRVADNPALSEATKSGRPIIPLYILDDETPGKWRLGGASRWFLHHALEALGNNLRALGAPLVLRRGSAGEELKRLIEETKAGAVYWNRTYEPYAVTRDKTLKQELGALGLEVKSFQASLLFEPWHVTTQSGGPYKVYTPFWRACRSASPPRAPMPAPKKLKGVKSNAHADALTDWSLLPTRPNWAKAFPKTWNPNEAGAQQALDSFVDDALHDYAEGRNKLDQKATSRLSAHLHFGLISPFQIWSRLQTEAHLHPALSGQIDKFLSEIGWREFSHHLLFHWPDLPEKPWRQEFTAMPWRNDPSDIEAWKKGRTGIPVVDAAMRELWTTGYMHNRARMITASFLIKHLLCDWRIGQDWFWDTLSDADLANNAASWQWVAGSGADAAPYFRIFNPVTQGKKFDPKGDYVRHWLPELERLPSDYTHEPWAAPPLDLAEAGVHLGQNYPLSIVDLAKGRIRALETLKIIKSNPISET